MVMVHIYTFKVMIETGEEVYRVPEEKGKNEWFKLRSRAGGEM